MLVVETRLEPRAHGIAGIAPPERRCQAMRRGVRGPSGEQVRCQHWTTKGYALCWYHLRRNYGHKRRRATSTDNTERRPTMPAAYGVRLSESLRKRLKSLESDTPVELLQLTEELKLAKATVHDVVEFYDVALLAGEMATEPKQQEEAMRARLAAGQLLRHVLAEVGSIAEQAGAAMMASKAFVGVQDVGMVVGQMVEIVRDELGDDDLERVARIADRLRDVRLPSTGPQGTDLTPDVVDADAVAMDSTVPPRIASGTSSSREEENAA